MITTTPRKMMLLAASVSAATLFQTACTRDAGTAQGPVPQQASAAAPQAPAPKNTVNAAPAYMPANAPTTYQLLNESQLDQLTGPIALYPDPLLAQLMPAATYPGDIQSAAQWVRTYPQPSEDAINAQPWDASVKAIVHYPSVLQMMNDRIDWTQALGAAFINQQPDVMASIQRLRLQAQAAGTLVTSPQQEVILVDNCVRILPEDSAVIYVPVYDPLTVYVVDRPWYRSRPVITFGVGFGVGVWLDNDCDWHEHRVMVSADWRHDVRSERERGGARVTNNITVNKNTTVVNNNTTVNVGRTGGNAWTRNTSKPAPAIPQTVAHQLGVQPRGDARDIKPAPAPAPAADRKPDNHSFAPAPTNSPPPAAPRGESPKYAPPPEPPKVESPRHAPPPETPKFEPPRRVEPAEPPKAEPPRHEPPPDAPRDAGKDKDHEKDK